jgi:hypothetical protein
MGDGIASDSDGAAGVDKPLEKASGRLPVDCTTSCDACGFVHFDYSKGLDGPAEDILHLPHVQLADEMEELKQEVKAGGMTKLRHHTTPTD